MLLREFCSLLFDTSKIQTGNHGRVLERLHGQIGRCLQGTLALSSRARQGTMLTEPSSTTGRIRRTPNRARRHTVPQQPRPSRRRREEAQRARRSRRIRQHQRQRSRNANATTHAPPLSLAPSAPPSLPHLAHSYAAIRHRRDASSECGAVERNQCSARRARGAGLWARGRGWGCRG